MDPIVAGSVVSAGAGIVSNAFNNYAIRKNNEYQTKLWREQMEYNSPKAQMERYREAGLNPHLIYGQGSSGNVGNAPATQPGSLDLTNIANIISTYLDLKQKDVAITEKYTDIEGKDLDNKNKEIKNIGDNLDLSGKRRQSYEDNWLMQPNRDSPAMEDQEDANFTRKYKIEWESGELGNIGKKIGNAMDKLNLDVGQDLRFVSKETANRWKEYGILPDDPDFLKVFKVGTKMLGLPESDVMNFIIGAAIGAIGKGGSRTTNNYNRQTNVQNNRQTNVQNNRQTNVNNNQSYIRQAKRN